MRIGERSTENLAVLEFSTLPWVDSTGIGHPAAPRRAVEEAGGRNASTGSIDRVRGILDVVGLSAIGEVFDDVAAAIAAFESNAEEQCLDRVFRAALPGLLSSVLLLLLMGAGTASPVHTEEASRARHAWGVAAGVPQAVALTYEADLVPGLAWQAHAFTVVAATSIGARLIAPWRASRRLHPYGFVGIDWVVQLVGDIGSPAGSTGYLWYGVGLRARLGRALAFVEGGVIDGEDVLFTGSHAVAIGLLWEWPATP